MEKQQTIGKILRSSGGYILRIELPEDQNARDKLINVLRQNGISIVDQSTPNF